MMVSQKVALKDLALKTFLGIFHLNEDLLELVFVRPQALFLSLDDPLREASVIVRRFRAMKCTKKLSHKYSQEPILLLGKPLNHNRVGPIKDNTYILHVNASLALK